MKQYLLKVSGTALLLGLMVTSAMAQQEDGDKKKTEKTDVIIIRPKEGKDSKVTVEIKDGEVKVNGKPLSEFRDEDVTVTKRKSLDEVVVTGYGTSGSRFRNGNSAWSYSSDKAEERAFLGVTSEKPEEGAGARLQTISEGSAADKSGFKKNDIITKINDQNIGSPEDLIRVVGKCKPEEKVNILFKRDGKEQSKSVVLGKKKMSTTMNFAPGDFNFDRMQDLQGMSFQGMDNMTTVYGRRKLGIKAQETEEGKGVKVLDVDEESAADKAGIKENDIITEFDGAEVNNVDKLREVARTAAAKPSFKVKLLRDGKPQEIQVKIPKNLKTANL